MVAYAGAIFKKARTTMKSNSWIIVSKQTGLPVFETYSASVAAKVNRASYDVLTSYEWLCKLNRMIKAGQVPA